MAIYYPPVFINNYLAEKVLNELPERFASSLKFFPTSPTDIDTLTETFPEAASDVFAVYDRMLKMRRGPFPHIKNEQLLYYFYKTAGDPEALIETTQIVQDLLDRGDESAQDINDWIKTQTAGTSVQAKDGDRIMYDKSTNNDNEVVLTPKLLKTVEFNGTDFIVPHFHDIKIYQLEETRDIIDFGTARTFAGNKIIIDYSWSKL